MIVGQHAGEIGRKIGLSLAGTRQERGAVLGGQIDRRGEQHVEAAPAIFVERRRHAQLKAWPSHASALR